MSFAKSLKIYFGDKETSLLSKTLLDGYSTTLRNEDLLSRFQDVFSEKPSLFCKENDIRALYEDLLNCCYHNEAFIKSTFVAQEINGRGHVSVYEVPVGESRLDLCKVNGESCAYEIKTDFDSPLRLAKQLMDYSSAFEKVYLVCSRNKIREYLPLLPDFVGLFAYEDSARGKVKYVLMKEATISPRLDPRIQLNGLSLAKLREFSYPKATRDEAIGYLLSEWPSEKINAAYKSFLKENYRGNWTYLRSVMGSLYRLDYQYFFKTMLPLEKIYNAH